MNLSREQALQKLQQVELGILCEIDRSCKEHDITWFLDSGTALGAMRHGGFIPWDDDIDIGMMREDYDRFIELAQKGELLSKGYSVHTSTNTPGYAAMFAKVYKDGTEFRTDETIEAGCPQGIFVDVFPYDYLSSDKKLRRKQLKNAQIWQRISYLYHAKTIRVPHKGAPGLIERACCKVAHWTLRATVNPNAIAGNFRRSIVASEKESPNEERIILSWQNAGSYPRSMLVPPVEMLFEQTFFPAPAQCESYLSKTYGNWRELPKLEDRKTHLPKLIDFGDGTIYRPSC